MLECWNFDPNLRPSPHDIVAQLTPADSIFDDADSELNGTQQELNGIQQEQSCSKITPSDTGGHQSCENHSPLVVMVTYSSPPPSLSLSLSLSSSRMSGFFCNSSFQSSVDCLQSQWLPIIFFRIL